MSSDLFIEWNPWHGCTKISPGCKYCYVYRQDEMYGSQTASSECRKTLAYNLPIKKKRDGSYKIPSGKMIFTCFTSDFLLKDADEWRSECWLMIRERQDCLFYFFTKRIDRFCDCIPDDWGDGYENVLVGCTVENQTMADYRLPIFLEAPIKHKSITMAPLLEKIDISNYLNETIDEVSVGGESGYDARPCDYEWVLDLRRQCMEKNVPFRFHQTGAHFIKNGKMYYVKRCYQREQAYKANIDFKIGEDAMPNLSDVQK
ncbi:MAG: phage Gp37/Gp68 family protein [Paludibacteraceae bacterium]|nr:phage Gp37/Gp68 family protein [Paludibacteraceae bacterium]